MAYKIGLYGGTFDPIHFGHLNLAIEMIEKGKVDRVLFCPAQNNPLKKQTSTADGSHRLRMIEKAIAGIPGCFAINNELNRPAPSYTIDTLKELIQTGDQYHLLIGEDAIPGLDKWHRIDEIIQLVPLLIACRSGDKIAMPQGEAIRRAIEQGRVATRLMDISATEVRDRLSQGLYCGHLVPKEVLDYIKEFRLY
jgi:nicotinate-nucleotide adenylyltransferase